MATRFSTSAPIRTSIAGPIREHPNGIADPSRRTNPFDETHGRHLSNLSHELKELGVDLIILDQAIDTGTPTGELLFTMLGAISQFERDLIVERTKAGGAAGRRRGRHPRRPRALSVSQLARAKRLRQSGSSVRPIANMMDAAPATIHRVVREASK